ncbi:proteinase-activated receptor 1 [Brienomyrus brachyistius]|uniref:proteinase-activated receptor 1 n=1 Tax=Brienomyrus brachyistius TaxID=42636 RepID=UPI0020B2FA7D|nr:proteinase-activated receptor 1 [Brienomyrus brachyistius]
MLFKAAVVFALFTLCSGANISNHFTGNTARAFPGFLNALDEPIDYLDVQEESGSGFSSNHAEEHKPAVVKKGYHVTQKVAEFLTGPVMTVVIPWVYILVFIVSVPLNLLAVFMFASRVQSKKPAVIFMLNLAVSDLLFVLLLPFKMSYHFNGNNWTYGSPTCSLITAAFYCNMYCSILLMMCISVDRFLAVVYPIESLAWRSRQNAMVVCGVMWLLAIAGVVPILLSKQTTHLEELDITTCHDVMDIQQLRSYYLYFFPIFCSMFFFVPLAFTVVCYARIIQALHAAGDSASMPKKRRAVFMAAAVLVVFVVCFTPTNIILMVHYVQLTRSSHTSYAAYLLATCIGSVSCCLDPLIYYFGSSQCRKQVAAILPRSASKESDKELHASSTRSSKMATFWSNDEKQYKKLDP